MRLVDVAAYPGVSKQRAHQLAGQDGFPASAMTARGSRVWERAGVESGPSDILALDSKGLLIVAEAKPLPPCLES